MAPGTFLWSIAACASRVSQSGAFGALAMAGCSRLLSEQNLRQQGGKGTRLRVVLVQSRYNLPHTTGEPAIFVVANCAHQAPPCRKVSAGNDVCNGGLRQITPRGFRQMAVAHQRSFKLQWTRLESEIDSGTQACNLGEAKFRELAGFEGGEGGAADTGGDRKLAQGKAPGTPQFGNKMANGIEVHESSI